MSGARSRVDAYLLLALGMGLQIWPLILNPPADLAHDDSVIQAFFGALTLLALWGLRYPLTMLPLLLFEVLWKCIWLLAFALPRWHAGTLEGAYAETAFACLLGVIFILAIPWPYVWRHYVLAAGQRWKHPVTR